MRSKASFLTVTAAFAAAFLVSSGAASAQTSADDLRGLVKEGQKVVVTDEQGRQLRGRITELKPDSLALLRKDGGEEVRYAKIVTIDRVDDLRNGALIGLGVGLSLFTLEAAAVSDEGITLNAAGYVVYGALYAGLGAAAGAGIDALIGGDRNVYQRGRGTRISFAPSIGRDRFAGTVGISW